MEAKTLDFRIFFVIFSKQILKEFLEGEKIEKKSVRRRFAGDFCSARRNVHGPGERYREGVRRDLGLDL